MFNDVDIMLIFLRNRVLRLRQKYPLANFRVELFSRLRVSIPETRTKCIAMNFVKERNKII